MALFELIHDLLEHDPKDRPESAAAVLAQLNTIVSLPFVVVPKHDAPARPKPAPVLPVGVMFPPRPTAPAAKPPVVLPEAPDIHGWHAAKVQDLQQSVAKALGRPVVFRDPDFSVRRIDKVQTSERAQGAGGPAPRGRRSRPQESKASALAVL